MRCCRECGITKSMSEFGKNRTRKDGLEVRCKDCINAYRREYYAKNREKILAVNAKWYVKNKERCIAHITKWQKENPEKVELYRIKRLAMHADEIKAYQAKYSAENVDKLSVYKVKYSVEHPEMMRAGRNRYRARKANAEGDASAEQISARWELYGSMCYICGSVAEETDHVKPLLVGGSNWPANLRPICKRCNKVKLGSWPYDFTLAKMFDF